MYIPLIILVIIVWFVWKHMRDAKERERLLQINQLMLIAELADKEEQLAKKNAPETHQENKKPDSSKSSAVVEIVGHDDGYRHTVETYKNGVLDGEQMQYYRTGKLSSKVTYINGKSSDLEKFYDENGNLQREMIYENDTRKEKTYHKNGKLTSEISYINGVLSGQKRCGPCKIYNEKNGNLHHESYYENDLQEGVSRLYYENGSLRSEEFYSHGKREGWGKHYYENGALMSEAVFKAGEATGKVKRFFQSGKLEAEIDYKKTPTVEGREYFESEKLKSNWSKTCILTAKCTIEKDDKDETEYYESGAVKSVYMRRCHYNSSAKKDEDSASKKGSYECGAIEYEEVYESKELVSKKRFHEKGELFEGIFLIKYSEGYISEVEENYSKSMLHGAIKFFGRGKTLLAERNFTNGLRDGRTVEYEWDGRVKKKQNWTNGKLLEETEYNYWFGDSNKAVRSENYRKGDNSYSWDKKYYESGVIEEENIREGEKNIFKDFYESGHLQSESIAKNHNWIMEYYSEDGKLTIEKHTDNNMLAHGVVRRYYKNGNIKSEGLYDHGYRDGSTKQFDKNGRLIAEIIYDKTKEVSKKIYDKQAKEKFDSTLPFWKCLKCNEGHNDLDFTFRCQCGEALMGCYGSEERV